MMHVTYTQTDSKIYKGVTRALQRATVDRFLSLNTVTYQVGMSVQKGITLSLGDVYDLGGLQNA